MPVDTRLCGYDSCQFIWIQLARIGSLAERRGVKWALPIGQPEGGYQGFTLGSLARAKDFDPGTPVYVKVLTAREMRERLGLDQALKP